MSHLSRTLRITPSLTQEYRAAAIILLYAAIYSLNYLLPLDGASYTSRIWAWSQTALTVAAGVILLRQPRLPALRPILLGFALAMISAWSHSHHHPNLLLSGLEGLAVWLCFLAGTALFETQKGLSIPAFQPPTAAWVRSAGAGILLALPLAIANNLYFYWAEGAIRLQNGFTSALEALSPAIHEEIVFRFFIFALMLHPAPSGSSRQRGMVIAILLAVIPHSLNHLPDLLLDNPVMGLVLLAGTSLLFGLPMALMQTRRNLETEIAFHWFIDFARFLFGY